jgi:hypothetical protein
MMNGYNTFFIVDFFTAQYVSSHASIVFSNCKKEEKMRVPSVLASVFSVPGEKDVLLRSQVEAKLQDNPTFDPRNYDTILNRFLSNQGLSSAFDVRNLPVEQKQKLLKIQEVFFSLAEKSRMPDTNNPCLYDFPSFGAGFTSARKTMDYWIDGKATKLDLSKLSARKLPKEVTQLEETVFHNLEHLDLSDNMMDKIALSVDSWAVRLKTLNIARNELEEVSIFLPTRLEQLDLSGNKKLRAVRCSPWPKELILDYSEKQSFPEIRRLYAKNQIISDKQILKDPI